MGVKNIGLSGTEKIYISGFVRRFVNEIVNSVLEFSVLSELAYSFRNINSLYMDKGLKCLRNLVPVKM